MDNKCVACGEIAVEGFALGRLCYHCIEETVVNFKTQQGKERITLYTSEAGMNLFETGQTFWGWEDKRSVSNVKITVHKEDTEIDYDDIFIKRINSVKIV